MAFFLFPMKEGERSLEIFKVLGRILVENDDAIDALKETTEQAEEVSESVSEIDDEAKKADKGTKTSSAGMVSSFGKIAVSATAVGGAVVAVGKAIIELADITRDYRVEMAKLETAFITAGHTADDATTTYQTLYSVLGETDQAVEAANMLARLCDTEEQLAEMTNACVGIYATFGNSLPIEGLAEAANETAKVGTVTGQLADALNWVGISEDDFNDKLSRCNTERERAALITQTMVDVYGEAAETYKEANEDIIASAEAQERLNAAVAKLGEVCEPSATAWTNFKATMAEIAGEIVEYHNQVTDITTDPFEVSVNTADTLEEAWAEVVRLRKMLAESDGVTSQPDRIEKAIGTAVEQYNRLAKAAQDAAIAAGKHGEAMVAEDKFAKFTELTNQYVADAQALIDSFVATYNGIYDQVSGWYGLFDTASTSVTTSVDEMMSAMQSQIDFNNNYTANLQALKDYGLGALAEAFQSYGDEGAAYAEAIVKAVEEAGGATTEEGQAIIQGFSDMNEQVTSSQEDLAQTMALMNGEFEKELQTLTDEYTKAVEDLDLGMEANTSAVNTMKGLLNGLDSEIPNVIAKMGDIGKKMANALQTNIGTITIPFELVVTDKDRPPGFKTGLDYVPYDEFPALLHKGEAVLTAEEATAWRAGKESASSGTSSGTSSGSSGGVTVVQNITAVAQTPVELASATAAYFEQARWTL